MKKIIIKNIGEKFENDYFLTWLYIKVLNYFKKNYYFGTFFVRVLNNYTQYN